MAPLLRAGAVAKHSFLPPCLSDVMRGTKMTTKDLISCTSLAMMLFLSAGAIEAQRLEKDFDSQPVSNDGQGLSPFHQLPGAPGMDSFEGFSPQGLSPARFEDTGAAADGARPVSGEPSDFWSMSSLLGLGNLGQESILGPDNRLQVADTTTFPWRAVAFITFLPRGGIGRLGRCTGWFFGPDLVVTSGSCVHSGGPNGGWVTNVHVYPGQNDSILPFGFCTGRRLYSAQGWTASKDEQYNYGAIKLDCTVGNTVGWFGGWWQPGSLNNIGQTTVTGYPGLTQWQSAGRVFATQVRQVFYGNDVYGSGSPVFKVRGPGSSSCVGHCVLAIHTSDPHGSGPHSQYNHGTRITQEVLRNLNVWRAAR